MRSRKESEIMKTICCIFFVALLVMVAFVPLRAVASCDIAFFTGLELPNVVFTTAATQSTPIAHCEIIGQINPRTGADGKAYAIGFRLRLPDSWNERFYFQGGGGSDGNLGDALGSGALSNGYAVVSTDAGHDNTIDNDPAAAGTAAFGADPQARIDYGYNAVDKVTQTAKILIGVYYNRVIEYSYFVGCSNGGRQGMVISRRFPTYFDGIVAGSPGFNLPKAAVAEAWNEQALAPLATETSTNGQPYLPNTFSDGDLALVANAVLAACDSLDSLIDGIVDNFEACTDEVVYPKLEALICMGTKTDTCLSAGQVGALKKIFAGAKNSLGEALYTGWQWDPGIYTPGPPFSALGFRTWNLGYVFAPGQNNALNLTLGGGSLPMIFVTPPVITPLTGLEAYVFGFNFDTDAPKIFETSGIYTESSMEYMTPPSPATDLSAFKNQGGKMILYHGNSDGVFSSQDTINWYDDMNTAMDGTAQSFARLFLVPGMAHCGGGPATSVFDAFTALVNWVEYGIAPDSLLAAANVFAPWPSRTRPLCPYPSVTRYLGMGSIEAANNFTCVEIIPARVQISPARLSLSRTKNFKARIKLPIGYKTADWEVSVIVSEGAKAVRTRKSRSVYVAHFEPEDLINVTPGNKVTFTVSVIAEQGGKMVAFEGSDTVKVIE